MLPGVRVDGDGALIRVDIAPTVAAMPDRRRDLVKIDVGALVDVFLDRSGLNDLWGDTLLKVVLGGEHHVGDGCIGREAQQHFQARIVGLPAGE